jgi:hypothetical protein
MGTIDIYSRIDGALVRLLARHLKSCDSVDYRLTAGRERRLPASETHGGSVWPGFESSKNKWGLTSAYSLSLSLRTGDSASLTTAGLKLTPPEYPGASCLGGS